MAFVPNFSCAQTAGNPGKITFTDSSTGSDGEKAAVVSRRIYIQTADGTFLVVSGTATQYEIWTVTAAGLIPLTITLNVLTKDQAVRIVVQWLSVSAVVLYDKTLLYGFSSYNEEFDYQLTQMLSANPPLINDANFREHKSNLRTLIDSGNQAIELASDLYGAQQCYDAGTDLRLNSQYYFNINS